MARAVPLQIDPILAAIARAPVGEPFTAEQEAELAQDLADIAAGRARLVAHEDVPAALDEMRRDRRG
jgi:predicted transcriptional regulator